MRLTSNADGTASDRGRAISVLRRAIELGVNHIDTAAFYFSPLRSANELINRALTPYPDDLVITTKVWPGRDPSGEWLWAEPRQLRGQVEENLRELGRDHLDVVNLRLTTYSPSPRLMVRPPPRSGWHGRCTKARMSWPFREPAILITWRPMWRPAR